MSNAPREDVIKLAREAGFAVGIGSPALPKFTHLIQLVKAEEREACAALESAPGIYTKHDLAEAIRARSST